MGFADENFHPKAPWKERNKKLSFDVTATITKTITVTVPEDYDENVALTDAYYEAQEELIRRIEDWNIEDIDVD